MSEEHRSDCCCGLYYVQGNKNGTNYYVCLQCRAAERKRIIDLFEAKVRKEWEMEKDRRCDYIEVNICLDDFKRMVEL